MYNSLQSIKLIYNVTNYKMYNMLNQILYFVKAIIIISVV